MTGDAFLRSCDADYSALQRDYRMRGFDGTSHEMMAVRYSHAWRLMDGAEPSCWLSMGCAAHMRYGPYTEAYA